MIHGPVSACCCLYSRKLVVLWDRLMRHHICPLYELQLKTLNTWNSRCLRIVRISWGWGGKWNGRLATASNHSNELKFPRNDRVRYSIYITNIGKLKSDRERKVIAATKMVTTAVLMAVCTRVYVSNNKDTSKWHYVLYLIASQSNFLHGLFPIYKL